MILSYIESSEVKNGVKSVVAQILSDNKPQTLPTDGSDITGLSENDKLAPGSSIITINGDVILLGENGWGDWI